MGERVKMINQEANQMTRSGHTHSTKVRARLQQLNDNWKRVQKLKSEKEVALSNAQR